MLEKKDSRLRVIIVGGSVAGLTLAHCLHHLDIDFVLLEAGREIAPEIGASIIINPSGARILDQLGIWDDAMKLMPPNKGTFTWSAEGNLLNKTSIGPLIRERLGYEVFFLTRTELLRLIYNRIHDKAKILTSRRVSDVEESKDGVDVRCEDGSSYQGDIVVGADGVHSVLRKCIQRHLEIVSPGSSRKDVEALSCEYNCIFGISDTVDGMDVGESHRTYTKDRSGCAFVAKDRTYWFLSSKLDKRYYGDQIPRYSKEDTEKSAEAFFNFPCTGQYNYEKVWERRTVANMVCVEEMTLDHWSSDRMVIIGDAAHKMTPNLGAGANAAIESAAKLANHLSRLHADSSLVDIRQTLETFHNERRTRIDKITDKSNALTRIETLRDSARKIIAYYVIPALGDWQVDSWTDMVVGAEIFKGLPLPERSLNVSMPFDPEKGLGKHEKVWKRAVRALPLLLVLYGSTKTLGASLSQIMPGMHAAIAAGQIPLDSGHAASLATTFFGIAGLDKFLGFFVAFFTPGLGGLDPAGRMQMMAFLADFIPLQAILMIEGIRRGNRFTVAHLLPNVCGVLAQTLGAGLVYPVYFFLHYIQSPLEKYHAADNRLTQMGPVKTILPTIAISYIVPTLGMFFATGLANRQWINGVFWQAFPIYSALVHRLLSRTCVKDTTDEDKVSNHRADMPYLRNVYAVTGIASALAYLYVRFRSPVPLFDVFFKGTAEPKAALSLVQGIARFLRYDQISTFGAGTIWTLLSFKDLKREKKIETSWTRIIGIFTGTTLLAGPGAAMAVMWAWREEALAERERH